MQCSYAIPQYILDAYMKSGLIAGKKITNFPKKKFASALGALNCFEEASKWFSSISNDIGVEITPSALYTLAVSKGLTSYTPAKCPECGKLISIKMAKLGVKYCSNACSSKSADRVKKYKSTMQERYGVNAPAQCKEIKAKMNATLKAHYGVETSAFESESIRDKAKATLHAKYGVDCSLKNSAVREKIKQTNLAKYGYECSLSAPEVKERIKQTIHAKYDVEHISQATFVKDKKKAALQTHYGVDYPIQSESVKQKIEQTNLQKYGTKHAIQFKGVLEKRKQTNIAKYGVDHPAKTAEVKEKIRNTLKEQYGVDALQQCVEFKEMQLHEHSISSNTSKKELLQFIKSVYSGKIIENTRKVISPKELDIYLPEKQLAFEFNGTYWHSEHLGLSKNYHQEKTKACHKAKIRLIHIFEHEWLFNRDKIKSLIRSALGIYSIRLYARKCQIKPIGADMYRQFLLANHLQCAVNSSIRYGLFYQDELVSVIGFGKSRFKKDEIELHRYCVKANYQIVGGFSKLIKYACVNEHITKFVSYVDFSHFNGRGYKKAGFTLEYLTQPSYIYIKGSEIKSRMQCQKHKLSAFLSAYYDDLSESDNMRLNGWYKVYDCGNLKLKYTLPRI